MHQFRKRAIALRHRETNAEARLWQALRNRQLERWKFRRQHPIDRYIVDFVSLAGKLIVEVDGATHGTSGELRYDAARTATLEALGFHVVRVTNDDLRRDLPRVLEFILGELRV